MTCVPWDLPLACDTAGWDETKLLAAKEMAIDAVWSRTGRKFRLCPAVLRPCRPADSFGYPPAGALGSGYYPARLSSGWVNVCGHSAGDDCSCQWVDALLIPGPAQIVEVKVDGVVLDPGDYRVYDGGHRIIRVSGQWPACNDLTKPDTEEGTWSVTVAQGVPPSALALAAAAELACELYLSLTRAKECRLPSRIQTISRQGVTVAMVDPQDFLTKGFIGLPICDLLIAGENPGGASEGSRVYSPDLRPARRQ